MYSTTIAFFHVMSFYNRCLGDLSCQHLSMPQAPRGLNVAQTLKITSLTCTACIALTRLKTQLVDIATLTLTIPSPVQEALRDSITSGTFVDTKFWLFSKRGSKPGRVGEPKSLFVNGHVAKRVPRLSSRATAFSCPRRLN